MGNIKTKLVKSPNLKMLKKYTDLVPNQSIDEIRAQWETFHHHTKGKRDLTLDDFIEVYALFFGVEAGDFAKHMFKAFDFNNDGKVTFEEFLVGLSLTDGTLGTANDERRKKLEFFFRLYDTDQDGAIDKDEMRNIVQAVYNLIMPPDEQVKTTADDFADELFHSADENGDGKISFDEFENSVMIDQTLVNILLPNPKDEQETNGVH